MRKLVIKEDERHLKVREDLNVYEYPEFSNDISIIFAELNGRHPQKGVIINNDSDETYMINSGSGMIYMDGKTKNFKAGDIVPIKRGTRYYCEGKNLKFWTVINPSWKKEQESVQDN